MTLKAQKRTQLTQKKKVEKFRVVTRVNSGSPIFSASVIEWTTRTRLQADPLLLTVSRASGNAVLRNRWKRLIKEWFLTSGLQSIPGQSIWIRYNRTKELKKPIRYQDWEQMLKKSFPQSLVMSGIKA